MGRTGLKNRCAGRVAGLPYARRLEAAARGNGLRDALLNFLSLLPIMIPNDKKRRGQSPFLEGFEV
jgi:hypothetical protein